MANKTSDKRGKTAKQAKSRTSRVSRKVLGKTSAAYERKGGASDDDGEDKTSKKDDQVKDDKDKGGKAEVDSQDDKNAKGSKSDKDKDKADDKGAGFAFAAKDDDTSKSKSKGKDDDDGDDKAKAKAKADDDDDKAKAKAKGDDKADAKTEDEPSGRKPAAPQSASAPEADGEYAAIPDIDPNLEFVELWPPRFIQNWDPEAKAPPPAKAPPGDSRSFRREHEGAEEFALVYRVKSFIVVRRGRVGLMGTWTVTEYPHLGSAAHAYAQISSDLTGEGFRDLR